MKNSGVGVLIFFLIVGLFVAIDQYTSNQWLGISKCKDNIVILDTIHSRLHDRSWQMNMHSEDYCLSYLTRDSIHENSKQHRLLRVNKTNTQFKTWNDVYEYLARYSGERISYIGDSLSKIAQENELDKNEFADLVVSFVQDIPYSYVLSNDCKDFDSGDYPCMGNVPFGIVSPYEFIHHLKGDCDTRSVLLFSLMNYLKFKVMILVSSEYAHALIGVNLPGTGDHVTWNKRKYYLWETTSAGWSMGMLPPDMNNLDYWKIILANEF